VRRLRPGDRAPDGTALTHQGDSVRLSDQWPAGPTFLTFLRHFG